MKKLLRIVGNFIASPFIACADYVERTNDKNKNRKCHEMMQDIEESYNVEFRGDSIWITHKGVCVIPCCESWTLDELVFELKRIIVNSQNAYIKNGKEMV